MPQLAPTSYCVRSPGSLGVVWLILALSGLTGCQPPKSEPTDVDQEPAPVAVSDVPLRILIEDGEAIVPRLESSWQAVSEQPLELTSVTGEALVDRARDADVVIATNTQMGDLLAAEAISTLPGSFMSSSQVAEGSFLTALAVDVVGWGDEKYAVPLGAELPVLWMDAGLESAPPSTWEEYRQRLEPLEVGQAAEPLAEGWAVEAFLMRVASLSADAWLFDRQTFAPQLTTPPYVRALQQLVEDRKHYPSELLSPEAVWTGVADGQFRLAIVSPVALSELSDQQRARLTALQVAPIPRGGEVFIDQWREGSELRVLPALPGNLRFAALSARCRQTAVARQFMAWLSSDEVRRSLASTTSGIGVIRADLAETDDPGDDAMVAIDPVQQRYERLVIAKLAATQPRPTLRIAGAQQYRAALDQAIVKALDGQLTAEAALAEAAAAWEVITEQQGRDRQVRAWRQSQGLLGR